MRESVVFYKSFYDAINKLPDEYRLEVINAIMQYSFDDTIPEMTPVADAMFTLMKPNLDSATQRYEASVENGKKGGRPPKKENLEKPNNNLTKPNDNLEKPSSNLNDNDNDNVNVNVNDNVDVKEKEKEKEEAAETATTFYLHNVNPVASEYELQQIQDYENDLPSDLVIYALKIAVEQRKTSLSYIKAILRDWKTKGIVCLKQAMEERLQRQNKEPTASSNRFISDANMAQYGDLSQYYCNL